MEMVGFTMHIYNHVKIFFFLNASSGFNFFLILCILLHREYTLFLYFYQTKKHFELIAPNVDIIKTKKAFAEGHLYLKLDN